MDFECSIIRSKRKTICLQVTPDCRLIVRAPEGASQEAILSFVRLKKDWIAEKMRDADLRMKSRQDIAPLTKRELKELGRLAADYIPMRVAHYAAIMDLDFGNVTIRNQSTRWGSCSSKKNLNFNVLLMLTPQEVIDSIIVHELCHLRHMNHSKAFYAEVLKYYPDYWKWDKWLKENGGALLARLPAKNSRRS